MMRRILISVIEINNIILYQLKLRKHITFYKKKNLNIKRSILSYNIPEKSVFLVRNIISIHKKGKKIKITI